MTRQPLSHWPAELAGPILALVLIAFWILDPTFLSSSKSPVALLLETPLLTFGFIVLGAFLMAFISGDFDVRVPLTREPFVFALIGGVGMGIGAVVAAMSVHSVAIFNLAGVFHLTAFMTTQGLIYFIFMVLGGLVGAKIFIWLMGRTQTSTRAIVLPPELKDPDMRQALFIVVLGLFLVAVAGVAFFSPLPATERGHFVSALLLLVVFGAVVERGTVCMSSLLKEWFIARTAVVWRTVLFTIMCLALFYQLAQSLGWCPRFVPAMHIPHVGMLAAGSFLMGVGFIFADGCFIGSLWKIGQGSAVSAVAFFGMIVGTGIGQSLVKGMPPSAGEGWPNDLSLLISPTAFVSLLWTAGIFLLVILRPKRMW
jgi:uncharacterized membrane protein YedE/YeeE